MVGRVRVTATRLRGNPWESTVGWAQRPTPRGTLRVRTGAEDEGSWSPHPAALSMTRPALSPGRARAFASAFERLNGRWCRADLAEAFGSLLAADRAEAFAGRVVDLMPTEPPDRIDTLAALLAELPALPEPLPFEGSFGSSMTEGRFDVPGIPDVATLARMLDVTPTELDWFADHGGWLRRASNPLVHYRYRRLPKSAGFRVVEAPKPRLREIQRRIARRVLAPVPAHSACHGFEPGRSARTFAEPHAGAAVVVRVDLRQFFPSIGVARVRAVFRALGYPSRVAATLADLCTTAATVDALRGVDHVQVGYLRARHLPQGAPTSPRLANLVAWRLDRRLSGYARRHGLTYTRYADDLAFSASGEPDVGALLGTVRAIAESEGFAVHPGKIRVRWAHQRQLLAGLVVNVRPAVARQDYDALRALLHNCRRTGAAAQNRHGYPDFRAHVYGLIAWIGATGEPRRQRLLALAADVDWSS